MVWHQPRACTFSALTRFLLYYLCNWITCFQAVKYALLWTRLCFKLSDTSTGATLSVGLEVYNPCGDVASVICFSVFLRVRLCCGRKVIFYTSSVWQNINFLFLKLNFSIIQKFYIGRRSLPCQALKQKRCPTWRTHDFLPLHFAFSYVISLISRLLFWCSLVVHSLKWEKLEGSNEDIS